MHRKNFFVNDGCNRQAVKAISESLPQLDVVPAFAYGEKHGMSYEVSWVTDLEKRTFIVKAVNPIDTCTLVISTKNKKVFGVFDLVGKEQANGFQGLFSSIDIIAQEQVIGFRREATVLKKSEEVIILAMNVTCERRRQV